MTNQSRDDFALPVPLVLEASNNATLAPAKVLDGATVRIKFEGLTAEHVVEFKWATLDGTPMFTEQSQGASDHIDILVPAAIVGASIGKTVQIWYEARLQASVLPSHMLDLTIEHIAPADLPAPLLPEVHMEEGTEFLDMRRFSGNARVQLAPWMFIALGQRIWIAAVGQRNYPTHVTLDLVTALEVTSEQVSNGMELTIPREWLSGLDDRSALTLKTFVTFDGSQEINTAHELPRTTHLLRVSDTELPAPVVVEAANGVLDPELARDGATVVIKYDGMKSTDKIEPWWRGEPGEGTPELESQNGSSSGQISVFVPVTAVDANEGKTVEVGYRVVRDEITRPAPITRLTVQKRRYEHRELFEGQEARFISAGGSIETATMVIDFIEGSGRAGITTHSNTQGLLEGMVFGMCINADKQVPPQLLSFTFKSDYERISFAWTHHHRPAEITYFDSQGVELGKQEFSGSLAGGHPMHHWVEFSAPAGTRLSRMDVTVQDYSFFDFFTMCG